jgi:hypothetical protein
LFVLDEALRASRDGSNKGTKAAGGIASTGHAYLGEGDITALVMSAEERRELTSRPLTSSGNRSNSPVPKPTPQSSRSPRVAGNNKGRTGRNGSGVSGVGADGRPHSAGRHRGSGSGVGLSGTFDEVTGDLWGSVDDEDSDVDPSASTGYAHGRECGLKISTTTANTRGHGSRYRSPSPSSQSRRNGSPISSLPQLPPTSPHSQLNASRPTTNTSPLSTARASLSSGGLYPPGIASVAPCAPFKILLPSKIKSDANTSDDKEISGNIPGSVFDEEDDAMQRLATSRIHSSEAMSRPGKPIITAGNIPSTSAGAGASAAATGSTTGIASTKGGHRMAVWDVSDDSESSDDDRRNAYRRRSVAKSKSTVTTSGVDTINSTGGSGGSGSGVKYQSLVHRDSVIRGSDRGGSALDKEEFALDHATRRKMTQENVVSRIGTAGGHSGSGVGNGRLFSSSIPIHFPSTKDNESGGDES